MDRVFEAGAAAGAPSAPASPSTGYPTSGDPGTGIPATTPGAWWFHMITEELRAVIVAAGLTPDHASVTQLASAIAALSIGAASNAETQAGMLSNKAVTPSSLAATMLGGVGQSRQDVTGARAASTIYTNSTGRPIVVILSINVGAGQNSSITVGTQVINIGNAATVATTVIREVVVLPGETYTLTLSGSSISSWWEIR